MQHWACCVWDSGRAVSAAPWLMHVGKDRMSSWQSLLSSVICTDGQYTWTRVCLQLPSRSLTRAHILCLEKKQTSFMVLCHPTPPLTSETKNFCLGFCLPLPRTGRIVVSLAVWSVDGRACLAACACVGWLFQEVLVIFFLLLDDTSSPCASKALSLMGKVRVYSVQWTVTVGESWVSWAIFYIQHSVKGNILFFLTKITTHILWCCVYLEIIRIHVNISFENIAWHNLVWVCWTTPQGKLNHIHVSELNEIWPPPF